MTLQAALFDKGITGRELRLFLDHKCILLNGKVVEDSDIELPDQCTVSIVTKSHRTDYKRDIDVSEHLFTK